MVDRCGIQDIDRVLKVVQPYGGSRRNLKDVYEYMLGLDSIRVLMPKDTAVVTFIDLGGGMWDGHIIGDRESAKMAIEWMFEHTDCERLSWVAPTPLIERAAKRLDKYLGSVERNEEHYIERGSLCRQ